MSDREKIIKGLECCLANDHKKCPYKSTDEGINKVTPCTTYLMEDTLAVVKAQKPRVMTLEEIDNALKMPIWKETKRAHKDLYNGWVLAYDIQTGAGITGTRLGMSEPSGRVAWYKLDDYGKTWRCWTARPTDEQREAARWE